MIYSYTQISHYLACPRKYRSRYVDGWQEKDNRAGMLFGRAFERALGAYFHRQDSTEALFKEWSAYRDVGLDYRHGENWDRMLEQGIKLLELFAQDDRVEIRCPSRNLQIKVSRPLSATSQFVGYIDAFGYVDLTRCVIDWKTTAARYPEQPEGLLALDPQLACYSWLTGKSEVAFVVFVRKRMPEIQYLRATITEEQRQQFGCIVQDAVAPSSITQTARSSEGIPTVSTPVMEGVVSAYTIPVLRAMPSGSVTSAGKMRTRSPRKMPAMAA